MSQTVPRDRTPTYDPATRDSESSVKGAEIEVARIRELNMLLRSTLLALVSAGLVLAPTAAHAQAYGHDDATADVVSIKFDEDTGEPVPVPAPDRELGDITRLVVRHADRRIKLSVSYRAYKPNALVTDVELQTSSGARYTLIVSEEFTVLLTRRGEFVDCPVRSTYNARAERYEVSFGRWCVNRPTWVRAGAATYGARYDVDTGIPEEAFLDDAWLDGAVSKDFMATLGPVRLARGASSPL